MNPGYTLRSPLPGLGYLLTLGLTATLLTVGTVSTVEHLTHTEVADAYLTGRTGDFNHSERQAEWASVAPTMHPVTSFGTTESRAENASVMPRGFVPGY